MCALFSDFWGGSSEQQRYCLPIIFITYEIIFKNEMYAHCEILNIKCNISISDEDEYVVAFAILERQ